MLIKRQCYHRHHRQHHHHQRLVEEAEASRAAATANPYTSTRRLPASKYLTVPSKQAAQG